MTEPKFKLEKLDFDGPLDLLLTLIEKNKVDIFEIPISMITDQYLAYVANLQETDMEIISSFLVMVSTLLDIKARMLLSQNTYDEEEETDPREELVSRLLEYKMYKYIAESLRAYEERAKVFFYRDAQLPEELAVYVPKIDLNELLGDLSIKMLSEIFDEITKRAHEATNPSLGEFDQINEDSFSISECIEKIKIFTRNHTKFTFREMLGQDRARENVIVSFLAILELMKLGKITVRQKNLKSDLHVRVLEGSDLDKLDLSEIVE